VRYDSACRRATPDVHAEDRDARPSPTSGIRHPRARHRPQDERAFLVLDRERKTIDGDRQGRLLDLATPAKVPNLHAHRFRNKFSVELLLKGVPLERVSILLGHSSVKVMEKHYSPWIRERQEQAEADVKRTWARDPVALMFEGNAAPVEISDTQLLHGTKGSAN